jgi:hypothetical protein
MIGVPLVEKLSRTSFGAKNKRGKSDPWETVSGDWNWNGWGKDMRRASGMGGRIWGVACWYARLPRHACINSKQWQ